MATSLEKLTAACTELREAADPLAAVQLAHRIAQLSDGVELEAIRAARQRGVSWTKIGAVFGLSKQGAQQRFAKRSKHPEDHVPE